MDIHFFHWLAFVSVFFVAVISPGPDFVMIVRNSLTFSRKAGIFTALGLGMSILVHVTYTLLGLAAVIAKSILVYNMIKWLGAAYLIYIGYQAIFSKGMSQQAFKTSLERGVVKVSGAISNRQAFISGVLTNLLNPKAALFFLAVFSQIIEPETPLFWKLICGASAGIIITSWFSAVAVFFTSTTMRNVFLKFSKWIDRSCGAILIALGIKIALTARI